MAKDTKERILETALQRFSQNGYAGPNVRALTAEPGLVKEIPHNWVVVWRGEF